MNPLQKFLVPLDGSLMAEAALPVAYGLARPFGARVTLLYIMESSTPRTVHGERHLQSIEEAETYLAEVANRWQGAGVATDWHVHPNAQGDVARSLVEHAEELLSDVVVLTTHGSGGLRDILFGSIAQQVLRRGKTPTLIVRPPEQGPAPEYQCTSLLLPIVGGHEAERGLAFAETITRATNAQLRLLSVVPTVSTTTGDLAASMTFSPTAAKAVLDVESDETARWLETEADKLRARGLNVVTGIRRGWAVEEIIAEVAAGRPSLLILTTHGRVGLEGTLSGSKASRIIAGIRQPTLLIRVERDSTTRETES